MEEDNTAPTLTPSSEPVTAIEHSHPHEHSEYAPHEHDHYQYATHEHVQNLDDQLQALRGELDELRSRVNTATEETASTVAETPAEATEVVESVAPPVRHERAKDARRHRFL